MGENSITKKGNKMKKTIKNKWLMKTVVFFMILMASAFTYAEELRVGVDTDFAPFEFKILNNGFGQQTVKM